jgi:type I restriction-modification system DNA methylase subunit
MANEELHQRSYLSGGKLKGSKFGIYEELNIGATHVKELQAVGVSAIIPDSVNFPFSRYSPPQKPASAKPDRVFLQRVSGTLNPVAVAEHKAPTKLLSENDQCKAAEQSLYAAASLGAPIAVTSDGTKYKYVDVQESLSEKRLVYFNEDRDFGPGVLTDLLTGEAGTAKDPAPLAETVWQKIWHATKAEPKECLLTFVEIFVLKFLSDNLPAKTLPKAKSFYSLLGDPSEFKSQHGVTAIEYYIRTIRPYVRSLFPDNTVVHDQDVCGVFGLNTLVSKTSIINGFAFLKSSKETISGFDRVFRDILNDFNNFGPLTTIDPEFKIRLYEKFLRRSARQQKLGQFFTPRNVVRQMIRMARLDNLADGSVVLDPAAGVGGFVLEPPLLVEELADNTTFLKGSPQRRIKFIGVDVDANTHILAKANTLLHFAEFVRDPASTMSALNALMADTFVLMNSNETLGALKNPPREAVDVILTNPPYVTKGSAVYREEVQEEGVSENGVDLREHYDGSGLGVESLFLRYIAEALKPGGVAYVIVPLGMLNRTEPGPKKRILKQCNLLASIALPRNTFFNTAQLTYILVLEKRHTDVDPRPDVLCGLARSIGETLDWERVPTPDDNELEEIADAFIKLQEGDRSTATSSKIVKLATASEFSENDRWDVTRFWSDDELVDLGQKEPPVDRLDLIDEVQDELSEIVGELDEAKAELDALTSGPKMTVALSDEHTFTIRSGTRVTGAEIRNNPGDLPIYSCYKNDRITKGHVDAAFFSDQKGGVVETNPFVHLNANGASVGKVYARNERCGVTDDVIVVEINDPNIDLGYMTIALRSAIDKGGFLYEAKLFTTRTKELKVDIPVDANGDFDLKQQKDIASAIKRFDVLRTRLHDVGIRCNSARAV